MKKKISRRKFINKTGSAALAGTLLSQVGFNYAFAANNDPMSLLLGSHMDYLQVAQLIDCLIMLTECMLHRVLAIIDLSFLAVLHSLEA